MPTERATPREIADLMEYSARVVAEARQTVRQTRQILKRCRHERELYNARQSQEGSNRFADAPNRHAGAAE